MKVFFSHLIILMTFLALGSGTSNAKTSYGIYVGETMITSDNANDVLGNRQFSYNPSTKTLYVCNATLTNSGMLGSGIINCEVDSLNIQLVGHSTFDTRMNVISSAKTFSITGSGSLTGKCGETSAIYLWGDSIICTIYGPTIDLTSDAEGLRDSNQNSTLHVVGSETSLSLQGSGFHSTVNGLSNLELGSGIYISEPTFGSFSPELKTICDYQSKNAYTGKVTIGGAYPLYVANTQVTVRNASNITGDGITGNVRYDAATKTLTLNNASITAPSDRNGIQNMGVYELNLNVVGTNSIKNTGHGLAMILSSQCMSITGRGTLNLNTEAWSYCIRNLSGESFTINGPTINGTSMMQAFDGSERGALIVKGTATTLNLTSGNGFPVIKVSMFELDNGLYITRPYGAFFDALLQSITTDGITPYVGSVCISHEEPQQPIPADVNGDSVVDVADISKVIDIMASSDQEPNSTIIQKGDVNGDGIVDVADIAAIIDMMAGTGN